MGQVLSGCCGYLSCLMLSPPKSSRTHEVILGIRLNAARNHFNFMPCLPPRLRHSSHLRDRHLYPYHLKVFPYEVVFDTIDLSVGFHLSIVPLQELGLERLRIENVKNPVCILQALLCAYWLTQRRKQLQSLDSGPKWNARLEQKGEAVVTAPSVVAANMGSLEPSIVSNVSIRLW